MRYNYDFLKIFLIPLLQSVNIGLINILFRPDINLANLFFLNIYE